MGQPLIQRTFSAGEIAPVLAARADTAKYISGLRTCRNFFVRREGGVSNRPGTRFVAACKTATAGTRLMRFVTSTANVSVVIEMGAGYFRFYQNGAPVTVAGVAAWSAIVNYVPGDLVVSGGVNYYCFLANLNQVPPNGAFWYPLTGAIYEVPTPYSLAQLPNWSQNGNIVTLTNPNVAPQELTFITLTRWTLTPVVTAAALSAPGGLGSVAGGAGTLTYAYVVTSVAKNTFEEGPASAPTTIVNCVKPTAGAPNVVTWTADPNAAEYNIYLDPFANGVFGFIGTAGANHFNDTGFDPDFLQTPPIIVAPFPGANSYPTCAASYQQRRFFANSFLIPDAVYGSKTGFPSNFNISSPLASDDGISFRLAGNNHNPVRWMLGLNPGLILLTDAGEWTATGGGGSDSPIAPNSLNAKQQLYNGVSSTVRPVLIGNTVVYVQTRNNIVRKAAFDQSVAFGLAGEDLGIYSTHLLEQTTIVAADYAQTPDSIVWFVRSDGVLLGLTYVPEQEVGGWHRHDTMQTVGTTAASFEDVCVVPEAGRDVPYVIVSRTIGGNVVRYLEKLETRVIRTALFNRDVFFVDAGLSYSGAPATVFSGLGHLEGQIVAVVGDGTVIYDGDPTGAAAATYTVTAGKITIPGLTAYTDVHIGLPIRYAEIESLDIDVQGSNVRDKQKAVHGLVMLLERSVPTFSAGPSSSALTSYAAQVWDGSATAPQTGQFELSIDATFSPYGRVFVRQPKPLPMTILGIIPNAELGG
jgi:hypothetical protein